MKTIKNKNVKNFFFWFKVMEVKNRILSMPDYCAATVVVVVDEDNDDEQNKNQFWVIHF